MRRTSNSKRASAGARGGSLPEPSLRVVLERISDSFLEGYGIKNCSSNNFEDHQKRQPFPLGNNPTRSTPLNRNTRSRRGGLSKPSSSGNSNYISSTLSSTTNSVDNVIQTQSGTIVTNETSEQIKYQCPYCTDSYPTKRGLGVHKRSKYPVQTNDEIELTRRKYRWQDEEIRRLALTEAQAPSSVRFMNEYLFNTVKTDSPRTQAAIGSFRRKQSYREMVTEYQELSLKDSNSGQGNPEPASASTVNNISDLSDKIRGPELSEPAVSGDRLEKLVGSGS